MKYLVISDVHGNLDALQAVLNDAGAWDKIIFLGDIVDYGAQPNECISLMKRQRAICLVGNHDLVQTGGLPIHHMHHEAQSCARWTRDNLDTKSLDWLKLYKPENKKDNFYLVHGSPMDPALGYISSTDRADQIFKNWEFPVLFHGHSHIPVVFIEGEGYATDLENQVIDTNTRRCMINPGSVGQPGDGDERAAYGIWDDGIFLWKRVEYDIMAAQRKIREAGLPESQARRLEKGN